MTCSKVYIIIIHILKIITIIIISSSNISNSCINNSNSRKRMNFVTFLIFLNNIKIYEADTKN